ncbi:hypothetical protein BHS05_32050 [Myxococcus xanthus]|uniref:Uncharacterized protein n=1 Tax=Myxococcus xanthus TaxID=34 RepID=A0AAE6G5C2_MYXXA|nr:hypothetical protein BHS09_32210 [Myxococcus xanthus]QDE78549.1 hypothetical protein BHS08_32230 [Myxococcus xanthus]QDF00092.1 hypothetical protein BHS05_32050 [Myxococcus xanthus]QDF07856.1 hypothetical protein BHS04_32335 [Myxococcus xanthus]
MGVSLEANLACGEHVLAFRTRDVLGPSWGQAKPPLEVDDICGSLDEGIRCRLEPRFDVSCRQDGDSGWRRCDREAYLLRTHIGIAMQWHASPLRDNVA